MERKSCNKTETQPVHQLAAVWIDARKHYQNVILYNLLFFLLVMNENVACLICSFARLLSAKMFATSPLLLITITYPFFDSTQTDFYYEIFAHNEV